VSYGDTLSNALQSYIGKAAGQQLAPYSAITGSSNMGLGYSASVSASSSASSGPSKSGDISGGTAFNIGGINLGTQYPSAVNAEGGTTPVQSIASALGGSYTPYILAAGVAILAIVLLRR
jgi:hypothetical protein